MFLLPWEAGQRMYVFQGQAQGTHQSYYSKYAYDFAPAPTGDGTFTVVASSDGTVVELEEDYSTSPDCDPASSGQDNYVVLDHGDGYGSIYRHLAPQSVVPLEGATVRAGDALGVTGKTGYVCGSPHLHFTIVELPSRKSADIPFSDPDTLNDGGRPRSGFWYVSANTASSSENTASSYIITLPFTPRRAQLMEDPLPRNVSVAQNISPQSP